MKQFGSFSVKSIIPGFCVLILLAKRHKPPKQVNLTQNSVIQLKLPLQANLGTEKVSEKSLQEMQRPICEVSGDMDSVNPPFGQNSGQNKGGVYWGSRSGDIPNDVIWGQERAAGAKKNSYFGAFPP